MSQHLFFPEINLFNCEIHPAYMLFLKEWREEAIARADKGDTAASICHQASLIDLVLFGKPKHAWNEIMSEHLMDNGLPISYSKEFGKRLHKFGNQYLQTTVHAIHTRWWIECLSNFKMVDHGWFAHLMASKRQLDGLIYDANVSETILRHRMKVELTLSMAMFTEIMIAAGKLESGLARSLAISITDPKKCPPLGYMSMEFFRLKSLALLGYPQLFPVGIGKHIDACNKDLDFGWCDFSMASKVDAYMGTAKRVQRDKPIHSPLIGCHILGLSDQVTPEYKVQLLERMLLYASHLKTNPLDIPAFQMRDVPIAFGADKTPIEIISASYLINKFAQGLS